MTRKYYEIKLGQCHLVIGSHRQRQLFDKYFHRIDIDINNRDGVEDWERLSNKDLREMVAEVVGMMGDV